MDKWTYGMGFKLLDSNPMSATDNALRIEGMASTYDQDLDGESVQPGAFDAFLESYRRNPIILKDHNNNTDSIVGMAEEVTITDRGLYLKAAIPDWAGNAEIREKIRAGALRAFSIGGMFQKSGTKITNVQLLEISLVAIPANPNALFTLAKSLALQAGIEPPTLTQAAPLGVGRVRRRQPFGF